MPTTCAGAGLLVPPFFPHCPAPAMTIGGLSRNVYAASTELPPPRFRSSPGLSSADLLAERASQCLNAGTNGEVRPTEAGKTVFFFHGFLQNVADFQRSVCPPCRPQRAAPGKRRDLKAREGRHFGPYFIHSFDLDFSLVNNPRFANRGDRPQCLARHPSMRICRDGGPKTCAWHRKAEQAAGSG